MTTKDMHKSILQDYKSGMERKDIAKKYGLCYKYLCKILKREIIKEENNNDFYASLRNTLEKNEVKETTINRLVSWAKNNRIKTETELKDIYYDMYVKRNGSTKIILFIEPEKYFGKISVCGFGIKQYEALSTIFKDLYPFRGWLINCNLCVNDMLNSVNALEQEYGRLCPSDVTEVVKDVSETVRDAAKKLNEASIKLRSVTHSKPMLKTVKF